MSIAVLQRFALFGFMHHTSVRCNVHLLLNCSDDDVFHPEDYEDPDDVMADDVMSRDCVCDDGQVKSE